MFFYNVYITYHNFTVLCCMNLVLVSKCYSYNELSDDTFTLVLGPIIMSYQAVNFDFTLTS